MCVKNLFLVFGDIVVLVFFGSTSLHCAVCLLITDTCPAGQRGILQGIDLVIKDSVSYILIYV